MEHTVTTEKGEYGQAVVIKLKGELDHHSASRLSREVDALLHKRNERVCIIDMTCVSFMDSSGLGVLLGRYKIMNERGGQLIVRNPNRTIDRILRMSGIYSIMEVTK